MSSSAPASPESQRSARTQRTPAQRYRRLVIATFSVLVLLLGGLTLANFGLAPALEQARFDATTLTQSRGQTVEFQANQPLADAGKITVKPETAFTTSLDDRTLVVTFPEPLLSDTDYTISATDVGGSQTFGRATFETSFSTPGSEILTLIDGASASGTSTGSGAGRDTIRRTLLTDASHEDILEADTIDEFVSTGQLVIAAVTSDSGIRSLIVHRLRDGYEERVRLPAGSSAVQLRSSPTTNLFGFVQRTPGASDTLTLYDTTDLTQPQYVLGATEGIPESMLEWRFVPNTSQLIVQSDKQALSLIDPAGAQPPLPLGLHADIRAFIPGTLSFAVSDPTGGSIVNLQTGETTPLEAIANPDAAGEPDRLAVVSVPEGGGPASLVESRVVRDPATFADLRYAVYSLTPDGARMLYDRPASSGEVRSLCLSDNGQYLAIDVRPNIGDADTAASEAATAPGAQTLITDLRTQKDVGVVEGASADWCL
jgi:hypothetical protein